MHESSPAGHNRRTAIEREAAAWLARRDRGMTAEELADFVAWCGADAAHQQAFDRHDRAWRALDVLRGDAVLGAGGVPPPRRATPRRGVLVPMLLGLAAALMLGVFLFTRPRPVNPTAAAGPSVAGLRVIAAAPVLKWEDGSVVTENQGARLEHEFSNRERRVRLLAGEAHFKVAKDPQRPFLVETSGIVVRAVGTAFSVRSGETVEVLVTEGRVAVEPSSGAGDAAAPTVAAGEYARVARQGAQVVATVNRASVAEIDRKLAWQSARLQFSDLRLPDVIAAFNARNRTQLVLGDDASTAVRIDGTFRADNVDGFVRLLEGSFNLQAERSGDRIVLRQRR